MTHSLLSIQCYILELCCRYEDPSLVYVYWSTTYSYKADGYC